MSEKKIRIYEVSLPYPRKSRVRMTAVDLDRRHKPQPFFFAKDVAKVFHMKETEALKLAVPHLDAIANTKLISLKGYFQVAFFGDKKINHILQHQATQLLIETFTHRNLKPYLDIISTQKGH